MSCAAQIQIHRLSQPTRGIAFLKRNSLKAAHPILHGIYFTASSLHVIIFLLIEPPLTLFSEERAYQDRNIKDKGITRDLGPGQKIKGTLDSVCRRKGQKFGNVYNFFLFPSKHGPTLPMTAFPTQLLEGLCRPQIPLPKESPLASPGSVPVKQNKQIAHAFGTKAGFSSPIYEQKIEWCFKRGRLINLFFSLTLRSSSEGKKRKILARCKLLRIFHFLLLYKC